MKTIVYYGNKYENVPDWAEYIFTDRHGTIFISDKRPVILYGSFGWGVAEQPYRMDEFARRVGPCREWMHTRAKISDLERAMFNEPCRCMGRLEKRIEKLERLIERLYINHNE